VLGRAVRDGLQISAGTRHAPMLSLAIVPLSIVTD
jgi:hypothetical protein